MKTTLAILGEDEKTRYIEVSNRNGVVDQDLATLGPMQHATLIAKSKAYGISMEDLYPFVAGPKLHLSLPTTVHGRFLLPDGSPAVGLTVQPYEMILNKKLGPGRIGWLAVDGAYAKELSVKTGPDGSFSMPGMPQDSRISLEVIDPRFTSVQNDRLEIGIASSVDVPTVQLTEGFEVDGMVSRAGRPVPGVRVLAETIMTASDSSTVSSGEAWTDSTGHYRLAKLAKGYNLELSCRTPFSER